MLDWLAPLSTRRQFGRLFHDLTGLDLARSTTGPFYFFVRLCLFHPLFVRSFTCFLAYDRWRELQQGLVAFSSTPANIQRLPADSGFVLSHSCRHSLPGAIPRPWAVRTSSWRSGTHGKILRFPSRCSYWRDFFFQGPALTRRRIHFPGALPGHGSPTERRLRCSMFSMNGRLTQSGPPILAHDGFRCTCYYCNDGPAIQRARRSFVCRLGPSH